MQLNKREPGASAQGLPAGTERQNRYILVQALCTGLGESSRILPTVERLFATADSDLCRLTR
jgi:hypothetical protein